MTRLLFVCVHNAGRSQMAAAFARHLAGDRVEAESAGTMPSERVHPAVVEAMRERGIDLSASVPKLLTPEMVSRADRVITMGCAVEEACPAVFVPSEDWALEDPAGKPLEEVRRVRDEVEARVPRAAGRDGPLRGRGPRAMSRGFSDNGTYERRKRLLPAPPDGLQ